MNWSIAQVLRAEAVNTSSAVGPAIDLGATYRLLRQTLEVNVASGTLPTLDVRLDSSPDGVKAWRTFATFTRATTVAIERLTSIALDRFVRVAWTIGGTTPSFTFGLAGFKGIVYANLEDLDAKGVPARALLMRTGHQKSEAIAAASMKADGKLAQRFDMPISTWGIDLTEAVVKIAAYDEMSVRGWNPDGSDANFRDRFKDAMAWLDQVADSRVQPIGLVDSTVSVIDDGVAIVTTPRRGW